MYRLNEETLQYFPRIPAQPIGYSEAQVLLKYANIDVSSKEGCKNYFYLVICKVLISQIRHGLAN